MSGKAVDAGKTFLAGVLAKISDPEKRAQAEAIFNDTTAQEALIVAGTGALGQSEINRRFDELKAKEDTLAEDYQNLNSWYADNKAKLEEYVELKKGGGTPPPAPGTPPAPTAQIDESKFLSREDFTKTMQQEQLAAANYLALQNVLTLQHFQHFGEVLDTRDLLADPKLGSRLSDGRTYGLTDAYQTKFSAQLTERAQKTEADRINKLVEAQVAERMKGQPMLPHPMRGSGSPLDVLDATTAPDPNQFTAAAAAEEYARLQAGRASS